MKAYPSIIPIRLGRSSSPVDPHHRVSRAPAGGWPPVEFLKFQISNLKVSFRRFFDSDSDSNPSHPSRRSRGEEWPPARTLIEGLTESYEVDCFHSIALPGAAF